MKMPELSNELQSWLGQWDLVNPSTLLILQDEATYKVGNIHMSELTRKREQLRIGTGWILAKCPGGELVHDRLEDIKIGDRVKFPSGVTMSAECPIEVAESERVQMLHLDNLIMISHCGHDNP